MTDGMIPSRKFLVRCKTTHRLGLVDTVVFPPLPSGHDLLVMWQGELDFSMMGRDEVELERDMTLEHWQRLPFSVRDHTPDGSFMPLEIPPAHD